MKKNEKTINDFINHQITSYALDNDEKTKRKIRIKLIRTMTNPKPNSYFKNKKNVWKNAKTITQNGAKTKILSNEVLNHLSQETQNYFENLAIKNSDLTVTEFRKLKAKHNQNYSFALTDQQGYDYVKGDEQNIQQMYETYTQKIMLKAIFEHFYTSLDEKKIKRDLSTIYYSNEPIDFSTDPASLSADNRLKHPENYYYKPRFKSVSETEMKQDK